mmetsp:Transcript_38373/g.80442  ORF Transcript_38373/g.80442 Transcript_38373/m.80442 type:complete len:93 (-) Transcript_38373:108-386(-)
MPPGDIPNLLEWAVVILPVCCAKAEDTALRDASTPVIQATNVRTRGKSFIAVATTGLNTPQVCLYPRSGKQENAKPNGNIPWGTKANMAGEV